MKKILILWNELSQDYIKWVFENEPILKDYQFSIIANRQKLDVLIPIDSNLNAEERGLKEFSHIIVLYELTWKKNDETNYNYSDLYGIKLVKDELRLNHKLKQPILFVSMLPLSYILSDASNEILKAVGHSFLRLPFNAENLSNILQNLNELTKLQLLDVRLNFCTPNGLIGEVEHRYSGKISTIIAKIDDKTNEDTLKKELINIVDLYIRDIKSIYPEPLPNILSDLVNEFNRYVNKNQFEHLTAILKSIRENLIIPGTDDDSAKGKKEGNWKILILEDEPKRQATVDLINALKERDFSDDSIIIAETYEEAKIAIDNDKFNFITVILADYRLEEEWNGTEEKPTKRQQSKQGYDFINDVSQLSRFNALFVLSGLSRSFLLQSFAGYPRKPFIFSKTDLEQSKNAVNMLADMILDQGNEMHEIILNRPITGNWKNIQKHYLYHRTQNHEETEKYICKQVSDYIKIIETAIRNRDYEFVIPTYIDNIEKNLSDNNIKNFNIFKNILILRRIMIWMKLIMRFETMKILSCFYGFLDVDKCICENNTNRKNFDNRGKQKFIALALTPPGIPFGLLIEEIIWLKSIGYNIDDNNDNILLLSQAHIHLEEGLKRFIKQCPQCFNDFLEKNEDYKDYFTTDNNHTPIFHFFKDGRDVLYKLYDFLDKNKHTEGLKKIKQAIQEILEAINNDENLTGFSTQFESLLKFFKH